DSCSFPCAVQVRSLKALGVLPEPLIVTQVSATTATVNQTSITDTATLTGPNGTVTGSVAFFVCGPTGGATPCVSGGASAGTKTLSGGQATSDGFTPSAAGTYCFRVEYTPDANAQYSPGVSSVTTNECFTAVEKATPTITTAIHLGTDGANPADVQDTNIALGSPIPDKATVSGSGPTPTGSVDFPFYSSNDCSGTGTAAGTVSLVGGVAHPSSTEGPLTPGDYSFKAHYGGDSNYK